MSDILTIQDRIEIIEDYVLLGYHSRNTALMHLDALAKMLQKANVVYELGIRDENLVKAVLYSGTDFDFAVKTYQELKDNYKNYELYVEEQTVIKCTNLSTNLKPQVPMCGDD